VRLALVCHGRWSSPTWISLVVAVLAALACTAPSERGDAEEPAATDGAVATAAVAGPPIDLERYRLVDMTHAFTPDAPYWPTAGEGFVLHQDSFGMTEGGYFYSSNSFSAPEHGGTHLDAPIHFAEHGWTADQVPLERLVTPAVVIDVTAKTAGDPDYRLTAADVTAWESEHGQIPAGVAVYLRTGWESRWPDRKSYLGDDTPNDASKLHFPSFGEDSARLLVEQRKVAALGIDTASIDYGPSTDFIVHRVATAANVVGFENVAGLAALPATGAWTLALPMKIEKGTGGPLRLIGVVPR
jgi:kynurenine formamidase